MYRDENIRIKTDLSTQTWQDRKDWQGIFKALSEKNRQPKILYPARLPFRIDGEIRTIQNRQELNKFVTTKPALHEILRGVYKSKKIPRVIQNKNLQSIKIKTSQAT